MLVIVVSDSHPDGIRMIQMTNDALQDVGIEEHVFNAGSRLYHPIISIRWCSVSPLSTI